MVALSHLHSFGLNAHCEQLLSLSDDSDIFHWCQRLQDTGNYWLLGEGSNTVFVEDFDGTVVTINLTGIQTERIHQGTLVRVAAGENWHQFVTWCLNNGLYGLENLALIPGSVGASPIQNIGAYGREVKSFVDSVEFWDFEQNAPVKISGAQCQFGYRDSVFKHQLAGKGIVTAVNFLIPDHWQPVHDYGDLATLERPSARDIFEAVVNIRRAKLPDPKQLGNAGSFFKNPVIGTDTFSQLQSEHPDIPHYSDSLGVKVPAAWLIDKLGIKGQRRGGIGCHDKQALVLVNHGQGTGQQLLELAREIQAQVKQHFGISLDNEVRLVGRQGLVDL